MNFRSGDKVICTLDYGSCKKGGIYVILDCWHRHFYLDKYSTEIRYDLIGMYFETLYESRRKKLKKLNDL